METVKLIECINTYQGEGMNTGYRMLLCRFKFCNLKCKFCDTLVKMRVYQEAEYKLCDLQKIISDQNLGLMITGGEPTHKKHFEESLLLLNKLNYPLANVESNGFNLIDLIREVDPDKSVNFMYSPKIFNDEQWEHAIKLTSDLTLLKNKNVYLKLVIQPDDDLMEDFLNVIQKIYPTEKIYLMPMGETKAELMKNAPLIFDLAEQFKTNVTSRMHLIYDFI